MNISASTQSCIINFHSFFHRLIFINNKIRGLKQKCHFFSNSSQQKLSRPPRESFKEIVEEILGGNLECGSAQPSLFLPSCCFWFWFYLQAQQLGFSLDHCLVWLCLYAHIIMMRCIDCIKIALHVMWFCTMKSKIAYNEMKRTVWIDYDDVYQMMAYPYMIRCIW